MSWWSDFWTTVGSEFSDLPNVVQVTRVSMRLVLAAVYGGVLGYERQFKGKTAGVQTHMLVALGAALFVIIPQEAGVSKGDVSRVLQGLIAGVGFLGAGAIAKANEHEIRGLNTAAVIWLTAAIGVAAGMGQQASAALSTVVALVILTLIPKVVRSHPHYEPSHKP